MNWMMIGVWAKYIWAVAGPLVGVLIGAYIANRNQRKQWLADRKREEYQILLTTLTDAFAELLQLQNTDALSMDEFNRIQLRVHNALHNCIFTSDTVIGKLDIFKVWAEASTRLRQGGKLEFSLSTSGLFEDIRQMAIKDINS